MHDGYVDAASADSLASRIVIVRRKNFGSRSIDCATETFRALAFLATV
jgi:hypothetical protein